jgi:8-oxo-dGTP pyrophosphatase MutT (NUDIX family)
VQDLPPSLQERATAFLAAGADAEVAPARDAATVVLLRDGGTAGLEVYLLRRTGSMAFAAGMHVFPGGSVDPRDAEAHVDWAGPPPARWAEWLACDERLARALVCAAVRETFEESGVLLAGHVSGSPEDVVADTTTDDVERDRLALLDRSLSMAELLARRGLVLRSDLLRPWAHWITPEFEPRRFDTRFFVAAVPPGQRPRHVSTEADSATWLPVSDAVAAHDAGRLDMLPPTIESLRELATFGTVDEVLAAPREVRPVLPRLVRDGGRLALVIDGESPGRHP